MEIAILITAYHQPAQLTQLVECLGKKLKYSDIYLHYDLKSNADGAWLNHLSELNVNIIRLHKVYWGGFSQLRSIISLISRALNTKNYDYLILISGQDMPIKPYEELIQFLTENKGKSFIESRKFPIEYLNYNKGLGRVHWFWFLDHVKFRGVNRLQNAGQYIFNALSIMKPSAKGLQIYGGSDWWMLPGSVLKYCVKQFEENKKLVSCFRHSFIPSEMFFQTVISNSEFRDTITNNNKRYTFWRHGAAHPECITSEQVDQMLNSDCYFARKFDINANPELFDKIASIF